MGRVARLGKRRWLSLRRRLSVRRRLLLIAVVGQLFTLAVGGIALLAFSNLKASHERSVVLFDAQRSFQDGDMMHDALRTDAYRTLLAVEVAASAATRQQIEKDTAADAARFRRDIERLAALPLPPAVATQLQLVRPKLEAYIADAEQITARGAATVTSGTAAFDADFEAAKVAQDSVLTTIEQAQAEQTARHAAVERTALWQIAISSLAALAGLFLLTWLVGRSIVAALHTLGEVAGRVVAGDLAARAPVSTDDEIGVLGTRFNEMADGLTGFVARLELEAQRDGFGSQLIEALEMADEEAAANQVVQRAMAEVAPDAPMELLLSDSSRASLERAAASATAGAPGCPVQSPFSCVAVRRGNPVVFDDSEALNACSKLRGRPGGACSAVCVPVTFMGRALGVLHATGAPGAPLNADQVAKLTTLATQAGARIGTVRAFQKTQLQASTDGLTGLINRRTFENEVRSLLAARRGFALAIADLDQFKLLNDTYGHEAGDRALRHFSQLVRETVRDSDIVARFGGEEFVIAFPDGDTEAAIIVLEAIRAALASSHTAEHPTFTSSFGVTDSTSADTIELLLRIADAGLYAAKDAGRDAIRVGTQAGVVSPIAEEVKLVTRGALRRPLLHEAMDEAEPPASGVEIR